MLSILKRLLPAVILFGGISIFAGCNSGGESSADNGDTGEVIIGLTDAEGDFLSYTVNVLSVKLIRADGAEIETLPLSTTVDFAQYTELTEFLTAATVPSGIYTGASIVLDYSDAQILVEDASGNAVEGTPVDADGNALSQLELRVQLSDTDTFRIAPGIPAHITLDFDLEASHDVDLLTVPALVTVEPVLIADTLLEEPKEHRLRGLLNSVNEAEQVFSVLVRPFYRFSGNFGSIRVHVDNDTAYEINRQSYIGDDGLAKLATLPQTTAVVAVGKLNMRERRFEASHVFAGTSVPWGDNDLLIGNVLARSGDVITVKGASIVRDDNDAVFGDTVTVTLGVDTVVTKQGAFGESFDKDDISIGQRVHIAGELTDSTPGSMALDASNGHVRMMFTNLNATVVQLSPLLIDLQSIDRRRISLFNFSGTGATEDADPDNYEVDTGSLTLSSLNISDPVKVRGFVNRFGEAPPDFNAQTIVDVANLPARLKIRWDEPGSTTPFSDTSESHLAVDLNDPALGGLHHVYRAGVVTDLLSLGMDTRLVPNVSNKGLFIIAGQGRVQLFHDFSRFSEILVAELDGITAMHALYGHGRFSDSDATLTSRKIVVRLR